MKVLIPVVVKEFRQIRREPTSLGILLLFPAALIVLVGYALNFDVKHVPLAVFDQDRSPRSRGFLEAFKHTEHFDLGVFVSGYPEIEDLFHRGEAKIALVIPTDFSEDLLAGRNTRVQILVDGANSNTALQALGYAVQIAAAYSDKLLAEAMMRTGGRQFIPIDLRPRVWYNPDLISSQFLIPGLIGLTLMFTAVISTSLTVVREKERGTMEQILVSPLRPIIFILGKTVPYLIIGLVTATAILILGEVLFGVGIHGNLLLLYTAIVVFLVGALGQGLLISTVTHSQQEAFMLSALTSMLPSFLLSGFIFPIESMPVALRVISNLTPTRFFLVIVRGVVQKGVGLAAVWDQLVFLGIFALLMLLFSSMRLERTVA